MCVQTGPKGSLLFASFLILFRSRTLPGTTLAPENMGVQTQFLSDVCSDVGSLGQQQRGFRAVALFKVTVSPVLRLDDLLGAFLEQFGYQI